MFLINKSIGAGFIMMKEQAAAAGGRGTSFAAPLRGLLHFGPSHDLRTSFVSSFSLGRENKFSLLSFVRRFLRHRFAITCLSRAPSRYIGPRVDKHAPTLAAPP